MKIFGIVFFLLLCACQENFNPIRGEWKLEKFFAVDGSDKPLELRTTALTGKATKDNLDFNADVSPKSSIALLFSDFLDGCSVEDIFEKDPKNTKDKLIADCRNFNAFHNNGGTIVRMRGKPGIIKLVDLTANEKLEIKDDAEKNSENDDIILEYWPAFDVKGGGYDKKSAGVAINVKPKTGFKTNREYALFVYNDKILFANGSLLTGMENAQDFDGESVSYAVAFKTLPGKIDSMGVQTVKGQTKLVVNFNFYMLSTTSFEAKVENNGSVFSVLTEPVILRADEKPTVVDQVKFLIPASNRLTSGRVKLTISKENSFIAKESFIEIDYQQPKSE